MVPTYRDSVHRFRFAVLQDGFRLSRWQFECISILVKSGVCELMSLMSIVQPWHERLITRWSLLLKNTLWLLFAVTFGRAESNELTERGAFPVPQVSVLPATKYAESIELENADLDQLRAARLDFLLYLGNKIPGIGISGVATYGVWKFDCGEQQGRRAYPLGFWEILQRLPVTCVKLRRFGHDDPDGGTILRQGFFPITRHSYARTADAARSGSIDFPFLACQQLLAGGQIEATDESARNRHWSASLPGNISVARFALGMLVAKVSALIRAAFTRDQWNVGLIDARGLDPFANTEATHIRWLPSQGRKGFEAADPFFRRTGNHVVLLAETMAAKERRGFIAAWRVTPEGTVRLGPAIDEKGLHLSYPYLCEWNGQLYCIPEQCESEAIMLYRVVEFPTRWERIGPILLGVRAADPTLFQFGDHWWLAYVEERRNLFEGGRFWRTRPDSVTRLMLWYATGLTDQWRPHALNPVKIDSRSARGAGSPFYYDGVLVRPSQDCSVSYGAKVVFNQIVTLTPSAFEEKRIGELAPHPASPYRWGLHTFSYDGDIAAIDGCRRVSAPMNWLSKSLGRC
jgi:hypothetical protein